MLNTYTTRTVWRSTVPERETVTLRSRGGDDAEATYTDYTVEHVQPEASASLEEAASGVVASGLRRRHFAFWQDALDAADAPAPKVGDLVVRTEGTEDVTYVVQAVNNGLFGNEFGCECQERA